jgi:CheY-like chemotaxis protein
VAVAVDVARNNHSNEGLHVAPQGKDAMKTVLLIDDNQDYLDSVRCILEREGLEVLESDCPDSAFRLLRSIDPPDLIMCDLHMPFMRGAKADEFKTSFEVGVKTAHELSWVYPQTPVVALTALERGDLAKVRGFLEPIPAFTKPYRTGELLELVRTYLSTKDWGGVQ